jgi:light-regulated signal transduction histidine kinase (bacteriophytochrome)
MNISTPQNQTTNLERENLLRCITDCIYQASELQEILNAVVRELGKFLKTDRVKIYQFHADGSGQVVAESIRDNRLPSLLGLNFPASEIPDTAREMFVKSRMRSIVNVAAKQIGQSIKIDSEAELNVFDNIHYRDLDSCHVEYLTAMGVNSSLAISILDRESLWGLLVAHHSESRLFSEEELDTVQLINDQLARAIAQANLLTQAREKAQREEIVNRITSLLHSESTIKLQKALEELTAALDGSGARLYLNTGVLAQENDMIANLVDKLQTSTRAAIELYTCGMQPRIPENSMHAAIEQYSVWQKYFEENGGDIWAIDDLYELPELRVVQPIFQSTKIRSILMLPLRFRRQIFGYLSIFRNEIATETLWAGQNDYDRRQQYPRLSFEVWREFKGHQARQWTENEIELCQALEFHLVSAVQQDRIKQQLQTLVKTQAQERAIKLQEAELQQQILFEIIAKTKATIELKTVFNYATEELRRFLKADRVGIYRFDPNSKYNDGEFIAEDVLGFPSAMAIKVQDYCFGETYAEQYSKGKIHMITDIDRAPIQDCHRAVLELFQVKAHLVVPLISKNRLWGLLCIHQCTHSRRWEETEIKFAIGIAAQLSLALEHSQLLAQTQYAQNTETFGNKNFQHILKGLISVNPEIQGTALISDEGLPLAAIFSEYLDEEEISAISVEMLALAEQIGFELDRGNLTHICVKGNNGYAFIAKCTESVVLLILTSLSVQEGLIVLELNRVIRKLQTTLDF